MEDEEYYNSSVSLMTILDKGKSIFCFIVHEYFKNKFCNKWRGFLLLSFTLANILHGDANQSSWHKRNVGSWWSVKAIEHGKHNLGIVFCQLVDVVAFTCKEN